MGGGGGGVVVLVGRVMLVALLLTSTSWLSLCSLGMMMMMVRIDTHSKARFEWGLDSTHSEEE
jgi:hypothetical protein